MVHANRSIMRGKRARFRRLSDDRLLKNAHRAKAVMNVFVFTSGESRESEVGESGNMHSVRSAILPFAFARDDIHDNVNADEEQGTAAEDGVHGADTDIVSEKAEIAVHAVPNAFHDLGREALVAHCLKHAAHGMIVQKAGAVGAGQEGERLLQTLPKIGDGHICTADEAVARADDGAHCRRLSVGGEKEINAGGKRGAEHGEQEHVKQHQPDICQGEIPAHRAQIHKAHSGGRKADDQCGDQSGQIIAQSQCAEPHGRDGEIVPCAAGLIPNHQQIGAERHGDTAYRQQGGNELSAHTAVDHGVRDRDPCFLQCRGKGIVVHLFEEGGIEHKQDDRCDEGREEHSLILEIQFGVASNECAETVHFSSPPVNFFPVTARKTSSILPLVIS